MSQPAKNGADQVLTPDLCVIGAGSGGLSVAAGAVQMGASVVLIEGGRMGGDCLNYGCVPSKSIIAAGRAAQAHRNSAHFGVKSHEPEIDFTQVMGHVHGVIEGIRPHDSEERFEALGVDVIRGWARFTGEREVEADGQRIRARRFVIATGSYPAIPPIPGLEEAGYHTNETIWSLTERPGHLVILGGGPIGMELAQAHRRLGADVTVIEAERALGREDPELAAIVLARLRVEGVTILEGQAATEVARKGNAIAVKLANGEEIEGTHLLVATGRKPSLEALDLDKAHIAHDRAGVKVTDGLRSTTNSRVYAIGDAAGGPQFTHVAGYHAGLVVRSALFRMPVSVRPEIIPRVTFTDPEIASVGITEVEAEKRFDDRYEVVRFEVNKNDRARAEHIGEGMVKAIIGRGGKILGCSIVAPGAGDLIQVWSFAISAKKKISAMAGQVVAYPTLSEVSKQTASAYYAPRLFRSPLVRRTVGLLSRLG